mgnify:CR=1 FL=1
MVDKLFFYFPLPKELDPILDKYAKVPGSLITILQKTQDIYGYISIDAMNYISDAPGIKTAKIYGVATFSNVMSRDSLPR